MAHRKKDKRDKRTPGSFLIAMPGWNIFQEAKKVRLSVK